MPTERITGLKGPEGPFTQGEMPGNIRSNKYWACLAELGQAGILLVRTGSARHGLLLIAGTASCQRMMKVLTSLHRTPNECSDVTVYWPE